MRVLLWIRPKDSYIGGDIRQVEKTANALKRVGVEVDIYDNEELDKKTIQSYDIIHLFILIMPFSERRIRRAYNLGAKIILSPLYRNSYE